MNLGVRASAMSGGRPLSEVLRQRTRSVHAEAERTGLVADILHRRADRNGYALFLRNILPAYETLEAGLSKRSEHPVVAAFARRALYRSESLRADILRIHGAGWRRSLPLLDSALRYADQVARAASGDGIRLVPHAYVRYFGDLSGGQVLKRLLTKSLSLPDEALTLYDFPDIADVDAFKSELREAIDLAGRMVDDPEALVIEALAAFEHNIRISRDVQTAVADAI
jgi:heme oxygenase